MNLLLRADKAEHVELVLKIGERVMLNIYKTGAKGVVVERLSKDYVRVKWSDFSTPTIHSDQSLRRVGSSKRSNQPNSQAK
jgi:hypothetical protein